MFSFKVQSYKNNSGKILPVILVIGDDMAEVVKHGEELKKFGAQYFQAFSTYGWYGSRKDEITKKTIEEKVKPAIRYLVSCDKGQDGVDDESVIISAIDTIMTQLDKRNTDNEVEANDNVYLSKEQVKEKLESFKTVLVNTFDDEEFKELIAPIIKFKRAQGYRFSLYNAILTYIQDPKATMVKSKTDWERVNRALKPGAVAIWLWAPIGGKALFKSKKEKEMAKKKFMKDNGIESEESMTPGEKERLKHYLKQKTDHSGFVILPRFYDIRDTVQMDGKEDLVGNKVDLPWYDDSGKETEAVAEKIYALLQMVANYGIDVSHKKNLNGALGVSKGGQIDVLDGSKKNDNFLLTLIHEFAHEALHHKFLQSKNNDFSKFYQGRENGRGFVEQQAELTAWIVCNFYGYNPKTAINYSVIWGMTPQNAVYCFNTVAELANTIIDKMNERIRIMRNGNNVQESYKRGTLREANYTGAEVANMVGAGKLYQKGMEEISDDERLRAESICSFKSLMEKFDAIDRRNAQDKLD